MPIAIDRYTEVHATARVDARIRVSSDGFGPAVEFSLSTAAEAAPAGTAEDLWSRYVGGVMWALQDAGHTLCGSNLRIRSNVPTGAGLSSSAAVEVACGFALLRLAGVEPALTELAKICRRAENEYVGARCGIMDQYIACHGRDGHALLLDCRTLEHVQVPMQFSDADTRIVVCNSMVRHALAGGEYNRRHAQCEAGVQYLAARRAGIRALRDVSIDEFSSLAAGMDSIVLRRCRHVISENGRVQAAAAAIGRGDAIQFGELMYSSHGSLRDDYEVSCVELDLLVELAGKVDGVYGARMTGGGFGGCTVNLVRTDAVPRFEQFVAKSYLDAMGTSPQIFVCRASDGVTSVSGTNRQ